MLAEPSAVTGRWCMIYFYTVLVVTCLDSTLKSFSYLSCSMEYCYTCSGGTGGWVAYSAYGHPEYSEY